MIQKIKKKTFPYKAVEVIWLDSEHSSECDNLSDVLEANAEGSLECHSAGFLVADKPDRIILATSIATTHDDTNEEQVSAYITIPKVAIIEQNELSVKKARKKKIES